MCGHLLSPGSSTNAECSRFVVSPLNSRLLDLSVTEPRVLESPAVITDSPVSVTDPLVLVFTVCYLLVRHVHMCKFS